MAAYYGARRQAKRDAALVLRSWFRGGSKMKTSQSGVALRLPPHSIRIGRCLIIGLGVPVLRGRKKYIRSRDDRRPSGRRTHPGWSRENRRNRGTVLLPP